MASPFVLKNGKLHPQRSRFIVNEQGIPLELLKPRSRDSQRSFGQIMRVSANCRATEITSSRPAVLVPEACADVSRPPPLPLSKPETAWIHSFAFRPFSATTVCWREMRSGLEVHRTSIFEVRPNRAFCEINRISEIL